MGTSFENLSFIELIEKNTISKYYSGLFNNETHTSLHSSSEKDGNCLKDKFVNIIDVPSYLSTKLSVPSKRFKIKKTNLYGGSFINLSNYNTIDDYLLETLSAKKRSSIRGCKKRLDLCIKPEYKVYCGSITREEYEVIFKDYKNMLVRRLTQKQLYWVELELWEERYQSTFNLINEKKACVFVIYKDGIPISVNINYIYNKTIFGEVNVYNIDFLKFSLGHLSLLNVVEWSIKNSYDLVDLSKGDFEYKKLFKNGEYKFQNHIIYDSKNIFALAKANFLAFKFNFIQTLLPCLKKIGLNKLYKAYKLKKNKHLYKNASADIEVIKLEKNIQDSSLTGLNKIDIDDNEFGFLKKIFNDFLFLNFEYVHDVSVYESNVEANTFFFKGKKSIQKYTLAK